MQNKFSDNDPYVQTQTTLLAVNNNVEFNVSMTENDFTRATSANFAQQALTRTFANPVPDVTLAGQNTIGAALAGIDQPPDASIPAPNNPCFSWDTPITLYHDIKPIRAVLVGQDRAMCEDTAGNRVDCLVIGKWEHWVEESLMVTFADGRKTHTHPTHKYRTELGIYTPIGLLDFVWHWDNGWKRVEIVEKQALFEPMLQYNLHIDLYHNYEANGDGVSNLKPRPTFDEF